MLDIKNIRPKVRQKAVYVTENNIKEFLEYAFPDEYVIGTLLINKHETPYIYAEVEYAESGFGIETFLLNQWYVTDEHRGLHWYDDEYFEKKYDIEEDNNNEFQQETH